MCRPWPLPRGVGRQWSGWSARWVQRLLRQQRQWMAVGVLLLLLVLAAVVVAR